MNTTKTLMAIATALAMTGCALPVARSPGNSAELNMLDKALEGAFLIPPATSRTTADASDGNSAQMSKSRLSRKPDDNLNRLYSADYSGPPSGILQDIADTVGWRFEQRGAPDANAVVRVRSASQPAMTVLRSIGEQFPYALVVDERAKSIMLDYTRLIIDPKAPASRRPRSTRWMGAFFPAAALPRGSPMATSARDSTARSKPSAANSRSSSDLSPTTAAANAKCAMPWGRSSESARPPKRPARRYR
ncbi:DotD/TraH family lipoprotein [Chromobacterium vaccinii]|uniref:DotD/TraH family lipoprotein n=1 Tax=Chromobacterium vaccinii TaxID=1108595 RepID=UPI000E1FFA4B|nr:DotD/TraH family lipoprotein [Chromobacterium vaccinii]